MEFFYRNEFFWFAKNRSVLTTIFIFRGTTFYRNHPWDGKVLPRDFLQTWGNQIEFFTVFGNFVIWPLFDFSDFEFNNVDLTPTAIPLRCQTTFELTIVLLTTWWWLREVAAVVLKNFEIWETTNRRIPKMYVKFVNKKKWQKIGSRRRTNNRSLWARSTRRSETILKQKTVITTLLSQKSDGAPCSTRKTRF